MLCTLALRRAREAQHYLGEEQSFMKDKRWDLTHWLTSFFSTSVAFQILCLVALSGERQKGILKARRGVLPGPLCSRTSRV